MYIYTVQHSVLLRRPPLGANSLHAIFFFFFFFKKYELSDEFGSEKYAEMGNLDLENLIKAKMDNFDKGIWCYLSVQQAVTQMVGDGGERQLQVVTGCSH